MDFASLWLPPLESEQSPGVKEQPTYTWWRGRGSCSDGRSRWQGRSSHGTTLERWGWGREVCVQICPVLHNSVFPLCNCGFLPFGLFVRDTNTVLNCVFSLFSLGDLQTSTLTFVRTTVFDLFIFEQVLWSTKPHNWRKMKGIFHRFLKQNFLPFLIFFKVFCFRYCDSTPHWERTFEHINAPEQLSWPHWVSCQESNLPCGRQAR